MSTEPKPAIEVFYSYSHRDEEWRQELERHLSILRHQGVITAWHDRKIGAGTEWAGQIDTHLNTARIILLLVSSDFLASGYCYNIEMQRAMERHEAGEARVIPIILRPVVWRGAPFEHLQALPKNAKPVTSWANPDEAFMGVAEGIQTAVDELLKARGSQNRDVPLDSGPDAPKEASDNFQSTAPERARLGKVISSFWEEAEMYRPEVEKYLPSMQHRTPDELRHEVGKLPIIQELAAESSRSNLKGAEASIFLENHPRVRDMICNPNNRQLISAAIDVGSVSAVVSVLHTMLALPRASAPLGVIALAVLLLKTGLNQDCKDFLELPEIPLNIFCEEVSRITADDRVETFPEQILEVVGGISNLYLEVFIYEGFRDEIQIITTDTFASEYVPLATILQEIANCSGTNKEQCGVILKAMQEVFRKNFVEHQILQAWQPLLFRPLGKFEVLDLTRSSYMLFYRDPAATDYSQFLLG